MLELNGCGPQRQGYNPYYDSTLDVELRDTTSPRLGGKYVTNVKETVKKEKQMGSFAIQPKTKKKDWTKKNSLKTSASFVSSALISFNFLFACFLCCFETFVANTSLVFRSRSL
jgi:hypothetical protein